MHISIIIPNYNGAHLLKKNLPAVFRAVQYYKEKTHKDGEIIIVDDASTDASLSVISNFSPFGDLRQFPISNFQCIANERNLGFSSTVNKGVNSALGDIIVLLNTDVSPEKEFLIPLLKHFADEKVFAVGAMDKSREEGKEVLRGRGIGKWQRGFLIHAAGKLNKETSLWVSGGSGAFRKSFWEMLCGLDELFNPFYWEDIDISYRALKSGMKIVFEKESVVFHEHERGAIQTKYSKKDIGKIAYRNQFIFVWKNADVQMLITHFVWLPYHIVKAIFRLDFIFLQAFFLALSLLPEIIQARKKVHKYFIYSDEVVIKDCSE